MLPPKDDPRWERLVHGTTQFTIKALPVRLLLTRVRLIGSKKDQNGLHDAIETAYDYFKKNEALVKEDLAAIFGKDT